MLSRCVELFSVRDSEFPSNVQIVQLANILIIFSYPSYGDEHSQRDFTCDLQSEDD